MQLKLAQAGMLSVASRFKSDKPRNLAAKNAMGRLQIALDGVLSKHEANAAKTELSADGKRVANRAGLTDAFAEILRSTKTVEVFNAKLNEWELRVRTPPAPDKSDLAAAILRSENRAVLRSRPAGERLGAALADPSVLASALEGS